MQQRSEKERLMQEALAIITGARRNAYGTPERNFGRIGLLWTAYLRAAEVIGERNTVDAIHVCHLLDLVKLGRLIETPDHEDSLRDRFGYNGCNVDLVLENDTNEVWLDWPPTDEEESTQQQTAE